MRKTLIQCIASSIERDLTHGDQSATINALNKFLPSGSGLDAGTTIDANSKPNRIILNTSFHHMNDAGYYDGWTHHRVIVTPTFDGMSIAITGRDRNQIKEYMHEVYHVALLHLFDVGWDDESKKLTYTPSQGA